jgi:hypothetical protein
MYRFYRRRVKRPKYSAVYTDVELRNPRRQGSKEKNTHTDYSPVTKPPPIYLSKLGPEETGDLP